MYPNRKFRKLFIAVIVALMGLLLLMNVPFLYRIAGSRIENAFLYFLTGETNEASMSTRNWLIQIGMKYVRLRPKTGYGLDNFKVITNYSQLYSHNNYVEILFSSGLIGFCIFYSKYIILLVKQLRIKTDRSNESFVTGKMLLCLFVIITIFEYWFVTYFERSILILHVFILAFIKMNKDKLQKNINIRKEDSD
jgi:O-antigen ligase